MTLCVSSSSFSFSASIYSNGWPLLSNVAHFISLIHLTQNPEKSLSFVARGPTPNFTAPVERGLVFALDTPAQIASIAARWGDSFASASSAAAAAQFSAFVAGFTDVSAPATATTTTAAATDAVASADSTQSALASSSAVSSSLDSASTPLLQPTAVAPAATEPIGFFDFGGGNGHGHAPADKRTAGCYRCVRARPARFILLRLFQSNVSENVDTNFVGLMSSESERAAIERRYEERVAAAAKVITDARQKAQAAAEATVAAAAAAAEKEAASKAMDADSAAAVTKSSEWHQVGFFLVIFS